mmetsp:Transcript_21411/g.54291  ORF Transcript_21411/g.54291 Transcript_21411/m.54291 type:complete len:333 (-) Transcript_21411:549-1547(-)
MVVVLQLHARAVGSEQVQHVVPVDLYECEVHPQRCALGGEQVHLLEDLLCRHPLDRTARERLARPRLPEREDGRDRAAHRACHHWPRHRLVDVFARRIVAKAAVAGQCDVLDEERLQVGARQAVVHHQLLRRAATLATRRGHRDDVELAALLLTDEERPLAHEDLQELAATHLCVEREGRARIDVVPLPRGDGGDERVRLVPSQLPLVEVLPRGLVRLTRAPLVRVGRALLTEGGSAERGGRALPAARGGVAARGRGGWRERLPARAPPRLLLPHLHTQPLALSLVPLSHRAAPRPRQRGGRCGARERWGPARWCRQGDCGLRGLRICARAV